MLVVRRMTSELTSDRDSRVLTREELQQVALVLAQGPVAQQMERGQGREAGVEYVSDVLIKEQRMARASQASKSQKLVNPETKAQRPQKLHKDKSKDQGMER